MSSIVVTLSLEVDVDCIPSGRSNREDPSLGVAVDFIPTGRSDMEDPSLGVAIDPSLGLTDGGLLGRGLSSQGSLAAVDVVIIIVGGR